MLRVIQQATSKQINILDANKTHDQDCYVSTMK